MNLSKHKNGYYYIYFFDENNVRKSITTKSKTKYDALKFLSSFEKEIENRKQQKLSDISFSNYCIQFLEYSRFKHTVKTTKGYRITLNFVKPFLGEINLKMITASMINHYLENRFNSSSIFQTRNDLICLKSLFNKALNDGLILKNPCKDIKGFRLPEKQPLFFTEIEFAILLRSIDNKDIKELIIFASQTGLRQMEIITLQWNQVNFKDGYLILDNRTHLTKSKKVRTIPLSIKALQILTDRQLNFKSDLVFTYNGKPFNPNYLSKRFKDYIIKSGINPQLKFRSLRHTFASWLVQRGVSIYEVSKLLGHSDIKVTEIYAHLKPENLRNAVELLN